MTFTGPLGGPVEFSPTRPTLALGAPGYSAELCLAFVVLYPFGFLRSHEPATEAIMRCTRLILVASFLGWGLTSEEASAKPVYLSCVAQGNGDSLQFKLAADEATGMVSISDEVRQPVDARDVLQ